MEEKSHFVNLPLLSLFYFNLTSLWLDAKIAQKQQSTSDVFDGCLFYLHFVHTFFGDYVYMGCMCTVNEEVDWLSHAMILLFFLLQDC